MNNLTLEERADIITHKLKFLSKELKPSVVFLKSLSPFQEGSHKELESFCKQAGGITLNGTKEDTDVADIILMLTAPPIEKMIAEVIPFLERGGWQKSPAVIKNKLYVVDQALLLDLNSGERQMDAVEMLAEIFYPEYFNFGYEGEGWFRFEWNTENL